MTMAVSTRCDFAEHPGTSEWVGSLTPVAGLAMIRGLQPRNRS